MLIGFAGALRRSELVARDTDDIDEIPTDSLSPCADPKPTKNERTRFEAFRTDRIRRRIPYEHGERG
jgi:hypothetical protein